MKTAALTVLLTLTAPHAHAVRPITPPAPEFPAGAAWVNSVDFSMKRLRGKRVVLLSFINTLTAASIRTFPQLNRLWKQYNQEGLMVIGVHSPDYDFDKDPITVREILKRSNIKFPIIIDSRRKIWKSYQNEGWPAHYLIDHKGRIIHDRLGEGGFHEFEEEILIALKRFRGYRPPQGHTIAPDPDLHDCGHATNSFYLGNRRGRKLKRINTKRRFALIDSRDGEVAVLGRWGIDADAVRSKEGTGHLDESNRLRVIYRGADSMAVLTHTGKEPARLYVKQNDLWLHSGNGGKDIRWDDDDQSYILVDQPRLYNIALSKKKDLHELTFYPTSPGIGFASFEFSNTCQSKAMKKK